MECKKTIFESERYGLFFRLVDESDSEFIVKLRNDATLSRYIHSSCKDIESQNGWIRQYKLREQAGEDFYFVFFRDRIRVGLARIYNIHNGIFTCGSWIFDKRAPRGCAALAAIIVREIAFDELNLSFEDSFDGVHVDNKSVIRFTHLLGLKDGKHFFDEKGEYISQSLTKEDFHLNKSRILHMLWH